MKQQIRSSRFLQRRKFLLVLPLLVLPFVTFLFWALGGGQAANGKASAKLQSGLNMDLPDALLDKNKNLDKLSYYHLASLDSNKRKEQIQNDPYYRDSSSMSPVTINEPAKPFVENETPVTDYENNYSNPNVARVYQKLGELDSILDKPAVTPNKFAHVGANASQQKTTGISTADIDRLEQMMKTMNQPGGNDPEMQQLNNMLEKIINIQHPERINQKLKTASLVKRGQVFAVFPEKDRIPISSFGGKPFPDSNRQIPQEQNGFYSLEKTGTADKQSNTIQAVIQETQTLVNGATVKLRLLDDIYINGVLIPKGHSIYGTASLSGERLKVEIKSIRYDRSLFSVALSVYDLDGMKGIYVPGAITRKVAKQSARNAMEGIGLATLNPSLSTQAAGAGIEAVKNLISKKVKRVKVTVKAGYRVLLKKEKQEIFDITKYSNPIKK